MFYTPDVFLKWFLFRELLFSNSFSDSYGLWQDCANSYHTAYKKTSFLPFLTEQLLSCLSFLPRFPPCNGLCQADSTNKYQLLMTSLSPSLKYQPHLIAPENHSKSLFFVHSQLRFLSIMKAKKIIIRRKKLTHPIFSLNPITLSMNLSVQMKIKYHIHSFTI